MDTYNEIKAKLLPHGYEVSSYKEIQYGIQFHITKNDFSRVLRIYNGKKGIRIDTSQLGNSSEAVEIKNIINENKTTPTKKETKQSTLVKQKQSIDVSCIDGNVVVGSDESGKGDFFGPLVVAAMRVTPEVEVILVNMGVKDCKKLTDSQNIRLAHMIKENVSDDLYQINILRPVEYNIVYNKLNNLNTLLANEHAKSISSVYNKGDNIVVDQFAYNKDVVNNMLIKHGVNKIPVQIHQAEDQSIAVAAASILARATYIEELEHIVDNYLIPLPKGASNMVVKAGVNFVRQFGIDELSNIAKLHFKTAGKIKEKSLM